MSQCSALILVKGMTYILVNCSLQSFLFLRLAFSRYLNLNYFQPYLFTLCVATLKVYNTYCTIISTQKGPIANIIVLTPTWTILLSIIQLLFISVLWIFNKSFATMKMK